MRKVVRSVLVVDDDSADACFCEFILEHSGRFVRIAFARTGEDALELLDSTTNSAEKESFDLVLLDVNMPVMTGIELLERLEKLDPMKRRRLPPIVMMTASEDPRDRARAESFEAVRGFLVKPLREADALVLADRFGDADI